MELTDNIIEECFAVPTTIRYQKCKAVVEKYQIGWKDLFAGIRERNPQKKILACYANCQNSPLLSLMRTSRSLMSEYVLLSFGAVQNIRGEELQVGFPPELIREIDVLVYQNVFGHMGYFKGISQGLTTERIEKSLREDALRVRIPNAYFRGYFPQVLHGNKYSPLYQATINGHTYTRKIFPYADDNIEKMARSHSTEEIVAELSRDDFYAMEDVQKAAEESLAELRRREAFCDVKISDYIEAHYRERRLFYVVNHPKTFVLHELLQRVLGFLGIQADDMDVGKAVELCTHELPIYPSVAKGLGLTFEEPACCWNRKFCDHPVSLQEWVNAYLHHCGRLIIIDQMKTLFRKKIAKISRDSASKGKTVPDKPRFLFPWHLFDKGTRVLLYGAGAVGKAFYCQIRQSEYLELAGVVDSKAEAMAGDGLPIRPPSEISQLSFDQVLVAVEKREMADEIIRDLVGLQVPRDKIQWAGNIYASKSYPCYLRKLFRQACPQEDAAGNAAEKAETCHVSQGGVPMEAPSCDISVIVPVYNVRQYLAECLESVVHQEGCSYEIICVDDGSTDGSADILRDYAGKYGHLKVYAKENGGLSDARNYGMQRAVGEYLCFLDGSDRLAGNDALARMAEEMRAWKLDVLCFDAMEFKASDESPGRLVRQTYMRPTSYGLFKHGRELFARFWKKGTLRCTACLQCVRRQFLLEHAIGFPAGILGDDLFVFRTMLLAGRAKHVNRLLYRKRLQASSVSEQQETSVSHVWSRLWNWCNMRAFWKEEPRISDEVRQAFGGIVWPCLRDRETKIWEDLFRLSVQERANIAQLPLPLCLFLEEFAAQKVFCARERKCQYVIPWYLFERGDRVLLHGTGEVAEEFCAQFAGSSWVQFAGMLGEEDGMVSDAKILLATPDKEEAAKAKEALAARGIPKERILWDGKRYPREKSLEHVCRLAGLTEPWDGRTAPSHAPILDEKGGPV